MDTRGRLAPLPQDESERLKTVEKYRLNGIGREPAFDRLTQLAASLFSVPIALVTIVGAEAQSFRGACGISVTGTPRDVAFCAFAILSDEVMVVPDAREDRRFSKNPLVLGDPHIRFYAGAPLQVANRQPLGTLCLIDREPRSFGPEERSRLAALARTVVDLIEMRVERFAAEEQRLEAAAERELLKLTVENVSEAVALVDGDLRLILWNNAFLDLFGYSADLVEAGTGAADLMRITAARGELGPGDPDRIVEAFVASIRSAPSRQIEVQRQDGTTLEIQRRSIAGGRFIMTARDITHERQIARLKDELVSTVSHELRTPLTAISGALGLLNAGAGGELPKKAHGLVGIGQKNAERLIRLVNDLLDLDKLQSGKLQFSFADVDLRRLLQDVVEQNHPIADRCDVALKLELPDEAVIAKVDGPRIFQVVTNLISNACKFSPTHSEVKVQLTQHDDYANISVIDRGPGISPGFRGRLFGRFAQESSAEYKGQSGTGLGLAISKSIVEGHAGMIELDTQTSIGATFHVRLPLNVGPRQLPLS